MFDQLLFTWVPGTSGGAGFQPVAATGRLADPGDPCRQFALHYCRYARPPGFDDPATAPVSFGWTQAGPDRLVFRRGYLGREAGPSQLTNFYAHILLGPAPQAPVTELARRFDSPFWWRGEPVAAYLRRSGGRLAPVSLAAIPPAEPIEVDQHELERFTDAVFGMLGTAPVVLPHPPSTLIGLVAALSGRLPGALEQLSVSTYEHLDTATEYDIVGMGAAANVPPGVAPAAQDGRAGPVQRARQVALSPRPDDRHAVAVALAIALPTAGDSGPAPLARLVEQLRVFGELAAGGPVRAANLLSALTEPRAAPALLRLDTARSAVVNALSRSDTRFWDALERSAPGLPDPQLGELGAALGRASVDGPDRQSPAFVLGRARTLPPAFTTGMAGAMLAAAARRPDRLCGLDAASSTILLAACAASEMPNATVVAALLDVAPDACLEIADTGDLPAVWRAWALANRLRAVQDEIEPVVARLAEQPDLVAPFVRALPAPDLLRTALRWSSVDATTKLDLVARALTGPDPGWDEFAAILIGDVMADRLARPAEGLALHQRALAVLRADPGPRCERWRRVFDATEPRAALEAATGVAPRHRRPATRFVLARYLWRQPSTSQVWALVEPLTATRTTEQIAELLMEACLTWAPGEAPSPVPYVSFVLECVGDGKLPVKRTGQLRDDALQHAAQHVTARMSKADRQIAARRALYHGGRANRWWISCRRRSLR